MHVDVAIIGAGMSGLAAGIRAAYFDRSVCVFERHYAFGGLNSYYNFQGRSFDVGLHALTNFAPATQRNAPLNKLLRQLRLDRDELDLCPQRYSEVRFPGRRLRFDNDIALLTGEVDREFPREVDGFRRLHDLVADYNDTDLDAKPESARTRLRTFINDPVLVDMLLCPLMYYGSAEPHDMDFTQFVTMFKALFLEGFARPRAGVRQIIRALVRRYRGLGGQLRMQCGVDRLEVSNGRVQGLVLDNGEQVTADTILSCAGYAETMNLCRPSEQASHEQASREQASGVPTEAETAAAVGRLSFVENIAVMDRLPHTLDHDATIVFFNDSDEFTYAPPDEPVDLRSGVVCCPSNYERHDDMEEGLFRVTWLANPDFWLSREEADYRVAKASYDEALRACGRQYMPQFDRHVVLTDMFTPRTIKRFTGHLGGAVYGSPQKRRDGRTAIDNLYLCGTDQGFLGIIGAMLSGITIANLYTLPS